MSIKQAIEALESVFWHGGGSCWVVDAEKIEAALAALRSMPQGEPVATLWVQMETHDMGQSLAPNPPFKVAIAKAHTAAKDLPLGEYLLFATPPTEAKPAQADALNTLCKMLHSGEEVEGDDGLAMLVPMDLWNEAQEAIELLVVEDEAIEAKPAQDAVDAELLDWLEAQINEHGAIHLHDGNNPNGHGLGLRPGSLNRSLREAIRAAISAKKGQP